MIFLTFLLNRKRLPKSIELLVMLSKVDVLLLL